MAWLDFSKLNKDYEAIQDHIENIILYEDNVALRQRDYSETENAFLALYTEVEKVWQGLSNDERSYVLERLKRYRLQKSLELSNALSFDEAFIYDDIYNGKIVNNGSQKHLAQYKRLVAQSYYLNLVIDMLSKNRWISKK